MKKAITEGGGRVGPAETEIGAKRGDVAAGDAGNHARGTGTAYGVGNRRRSLKGSRRVVSALTNNEPRTGKKARMIPKAHGGDEQRLEGARPTTTTKDRVSIRIYVPQRGMVAQEP